jgi:5'-nucleotidase
MRVLLCNDDGIQAEGISSIYDALTDHHKEFGRPFAELVWPIAPLTVQSATGHGITFRQPLITREVDVNERMTGIAVDGRPADCVKLALASLWPERFGGGTRPDVVISGINIGANAGINVLYSGTVAAALEAAFLGMPAIALSLTLGKGKARFDVAARHARSAIERLMKEPGGKKAVLGAHSCLNINIPITETDGPMPPIAICPMNVHGHVDAFLKNRNPLGETYYWSAGTPMEFHGAEPGSDVQELAAGRITVTPLKYDLSDQRGMEQWRARLGVSARSPGGG